MPTEPRTLPLRTARRLVVARQHLGGRRASRSPKAGVVEVLRDIAYVQLDSFSTVVPPQVIALWSRVPGLRLQDLDRFLWKERILFETSADPVSLVLTEDYPLHYSLMKGYPPRQDCWHGHRRDRAQAWIDSHDELVRRILEQLEGAELALEDFEGHVPTHRREDGWTSGSDVALTLQYLNMMGDVMVVGRHGIQKVWGLPTDFLPSGVDRTELPYPEVERRAAVRALRALGTASASDINYYFPRGRYLHLREVLKSLESEGVVERVRVEGVGGQEARYLHREDVPLLEEVGSKDWEPRLSLLSPYDNLIAGRDRTNRLFGFDYTHGNYLAPSKRTYGLYVLPILWGEEIIGRLDPRLDRETRTLHIQSVHAEPGAPEGKDVARSLAGAVERLADLAGATDVEYSSAVPPTWRSALK